MSRILRHAADKVGLALNPDGFCLLSDLLALDSMKGVTVDMVQRVVDTDAKGRFTLKRDGDVLFIRANQGHSMKSVIAEDLLTKVTSADDFPVCIHGTTMDAWTRFIRVEGLRRMTRNEIHFAQAENAKSGVRWSSEVYVYINLALCLSDGVPFYVSDNGVLLSPGIGPEGRLPTMYFEKVVNAKTGAHLEF